MAATHMPRGDALENRGRERSPWWRWACTYARAHSRAGSVWCGHGPGCLFSYNTAEPSQWTV